MARIQVQPKDKVSEGGAGIVASQMQPKCDVLIDLSTLVSKNSWPGADSTLYSSNDKISIDGHASPPRHDRDEQFGNRVLIRLNGDLGSVPISELTAASIEAINLAGFGGTAAAIYDLLKVKQLLKAEPYRCTA